MPHQERVVGVNDDDEIECASTSLVQSTAGFLGFLVSLVSVVSVGVIAVGVLWTANNVARITDPSDPKFIMLSPAPAIHPITNV